MSYLAFDAMVFAREAHRGQVRKYTGNPYSDHLAEVAGIVATILPMDFVVATAWLHDTVEDCGIAFEEIALKFGPTVANGVFFLSDTEKGNRAERKAASRSRLKMADGWIQTIKVADLISNTASIVQHDSTFAVTYLEEKRQMLDVLKYADERLMQIARSQVNA